MTRRSYGRADDVCSSQLNLRATRRMAAAAGSSPGMAGDSGVALAGAGAAGASASQAGSVWAGAAGAGAGLAKAAQATRRPASRVRARIGLLRIVTFRSPRTFGGQRMPSDDADFAERWRALAVEARAAADERTDPEAKRIMLSIADGYEVLARRAEARKKDPKDSK